MILCTEDLTGRYNHEKNVFLVWEWYKFHNFIIQTSAISAFLYAIMFVMIYTDAQFCVILCSNLATVYHLRNVWDFLPVELRNKRKFRSRKRTCTWLYFGFSTLFFLLLCCADPQMTLQFYSLSTKTRLLRSLDI